MIRLILITLIVYGSTALSSNVSKTLDLLFQEIEGIAEDACFKNKRDASMYLHIIMIFLNLQVNIQNYFHHSKLFLLL